MAKLKLQATVFPVRPGFGTLGNPIVVFTNYFTISAKKDLVLFRYHVEVIAVNKAPKASKLKTKRIISLLLESADFQGVATDFGSMIVSANELEGLPKEYHVTFRAEGEDDAPVNPAVYLVKVMPTGSLDISSLVSYLKETEPSAAENTQKLDIIQALNTIFGHGPQSNPDVTTVSQNKHFSLDRNPTNLRNLGGGLEAIRGFFRSVRPATYRLLLNANVSHAVCFEHERLDVLMHNCRMRGFPLGKFLKFVRITRLHLKEKRNKSGRVIPGVKTINDLATTNDGQGDEHPPKVKFYGAGPRDVQFWLTTNTTLPTVAAQKKGKGSKKASASASGGGRYISVWDYFTQREMSSSSHSRYSLTLYRLP